jgi:hypothetical protein
MSKKCNLSVVLVGNVHDSYIISIDVDCLVSNNQFFIILGLSLIAVSHHVKGGIPNIKLIFPLSKEHGFTFSQRVFRIEPNNKES